jgi:Flp pilus assembly protein TadG
MVSTMRKRLMKSELGAARLEAAITLPLILLVSVAIFEFGRAYQTWQVLTNAAREGARVAVIYGTTTDQIKTAVKDYADIGGVTVTDAQIAINQAAPVGSWTGSEVTISYPFQFIVLNGVVRLVTPGSKTGEALTMSAVALMRNES